MKIIKYEDKYKVEWDNFIENSKNGTFLLKRDYMEYHKDRFPDNSYLFFDEKEKLKAVIPGTIKDNVFYSHRGLTYGGFILTKDSKIEEVIELFDLLNSELEKNKITKVIYKCIPYIYYSCPSQEDEYALYLLNAKNIFLGISSTIDLQGEFKFNKARKSSISKSRRYNLKIEKDEYYSEFWKILEENLQRNHNAKPVHTLNEILYLKEKFPENIKLYTASYENEIIAGVVTYEDKNIVHIQYISANDFGKEISALDFIFNYLIKEEFKDKKYFDFGTSVEGDGKYLNKGLIFQKEGFGARGVVYKQFEYETNQKISGGGYNYNNLICLGDKITLRTVEEKDASFILKLRNKEELKKYISDTNISLEQQKEWIRNYETREENGQEFYFIVEDKDKIPCGTVRIYEVEENRCTWGSFILDKSRPDGASFETLLLSINFIRFNLGIKNIYLDVRKENLKAIHIYEKFGFKRIKEDSLNYYYVLEE